MAKSNVRLDFKQLEQFQKELQKAQAEQDKFFKACAKELAARLLAKVVKRTPVGQYPTETGKKGGTLRRGWTGQEQKDARAYANSIKIEHVGNEYVVDIINPVEYASYVEFGHRTANHKGWVEGQFMLTISEEEIQRSASKILEAKLEKYLKGLNT